MLRVSLVACALVAVVAGVPSAAAEFRNCTGPREPAADEPENFCRAVRYRVDLVTGRRERLAVLSPPRLSVLASPQGDRVLYGPEAGDGGLFAARPDGRDAVRLNPPGVAVSFWDGSNGRFLASFSPDGRWVAFTGYDPCSGTACARLKVYVVRIDGTGLRVVAGSGIHPTWSADGRWLAYAADFVADNHDARWIYVVRRDGTGRRRVGRGAQPVFAPRGRAILHNCEHRDSPLCVSAFDGRTRRRLPYRADGGLWSPDARRIAYFATRGASRLLVAHLGKRITTRVLARGSWLPPHAWSPDGSQVLYSRPGAAGGAESTQLYARPLRPGARERRLTAERPHTGYSGVRWERGSVSFFASVHILDG